MTQIDNPEAFEAIYAAWKGAGVDLGGGNWNRFVGMLPVLEVEKGRPQVSMTMALGQQLWEKHRALGAIIEAYELGSTT